MANVRYGGERSGKKVTVTMRSGSNGLTICRTHIAPPAHRSSGSVRGNVRRRKEAEGDGCDLDDSRQPDWGGVGGVGHLFRSSIPVWPVRACPIISL